MNRTLSDSAFHQRVASAHESLAVWCRERDYAGYDPFDGLNSRLFQATPFRHSRLARLAWTQFFKRSPVNLRRLALVPPGKNSKGLALFALAALANLRRVKSAAAEQEARLLLDELVAARLEGWSGAAWGYNFDWQARAFYAPRGTPEIVPTAFAVRALAEGARTLKEQAYADVARSACEFILHDLHRCDETADEVCFSYTPVDEACVFNASLLAGEALGEAFALTGAEPLRREALRAALYVVRRQRDDGAWAYGTAHFHLWMDNFHTAFNLTSLARLLRAGVGGEHYAEIEKSIVRGAQFWRDSFFLADGWPKYYHDRAFPVDTHSAAAAIIAALELREWMPGAMEFAERVALWALDNLRDPRRGFFYYQRRRRYTVRTPYMRWTQSWMLYALARLLEASEV